MGEALITRRGGAAVVTKGHISICDSVSGSFNVDTSLREVTRIYVTEEPIDAPEMKFFLYSYTYNGLDFVLFDFNTATWIEATAYPNKKIVLLVEFDVDELVVSARAASEEDVGLINYDFHYGAYS